MGTYNVMRDMNSACLSLVLRIDDVMFRVMMKDDLGSNEEA